MQNYVRSNFESKEYIYTFFFSMKKHTLVRVKWSIACAWEISLWFHLVELKWIEETRGEKNYSIVHIVKKKNPNAMVDIEKSTYHYKSISRFFFTQSYIYHLKTARRQYRKLRIYLCNVDEKNILNYRKLMEVLKWFPINYLESLFLITMRL